MFTCRESVGNSYSRTLRPESLYKRQSLTGRVVSSYNVIFCYDSSGEQLREATVRSLLHTTVLSVRSRNYFGQTTRTMIEDYGRRARPPIRLFPSVRKRSLSDVEHKQWIQIVTTAVERKRPFLFQYYFILL